MQFCLQPVKRNANTYGGVLLSSIRADCCVVSALATLLLGMVNTVAVAQSKGTAAWTIGLRAEFVGMGGSQLSGQDDGVGLNLSFNRRVIQALTLEVGLSASFHKGDILVISSGDRVTDVFATLYAGPMFHFPFNGGAVIPHVGAQVGIAGCNCSDAYFAIQTGISSGVLFPINQRLELNVGVAGRLLNVGPFRFRHNPFHNTLPAWGRQIVLSGGVSIKLGQS